MPTDLRSDIRPARLQLELEDDSITGTALSWRERGITSLTVETPTRPRFNLEGPAKVSKTRWRTPEFLFYGIIVLIALISMVRVPMRLSNISHPNFIFFAKRLSPGWIPGRYVDNSDAQYRSFRNNLSILTSLAVVFLSLSFLYNRIAQTSSNTLRRIPFLFVFSVTMIMFLHGFGALKILVIILINFSIALLACSPSNPKYIGPLLTWVFNGSILFLNEIYSGYKFSHLHSSLEMLDTIEGFYPRWHVAFNITMLRLVSFNMDYYWASHADDKSVQDTTAVLTPKQRQLISHNLESYTLVNYIAYIFYPPLYIGGPIITFNDFFWQFRRPMPPNTSPTSTKSIISYLIRFLACLLTMELILHYMYVVAIKDSAAWKGDSPLELSMIGFWNLIIMWLKLLIPWRFFRLWALLDGIDPPENMVRCMANNYSTLGFWRSWHRSYNLWLLRYIYIPVGGSRRAILSTLLVFTFVALWHDLSFRLLTWGWMVSLFIIPELTARWYFTPEKFGHHWWFRHICAVGAIFNILTMMSANLVGFVVGIDGMKELLQKIFDSWQGIRFLCLTCFCLFVGVQVMFEYREEEKRRGIYRRY